MASSDTAHYVGGEGGGRIKIERKREREGAFIHKKVCIEIIHFNSIAVISEVTCRGEINV